ncbi:MAG: hypothetical protein IT289_08130 [Oligoflexia bacterium]|nr:hypothetical protein [Oligoflexia bacterium]
MKVRGIWQEVLEPTPKADSGESVSFKQIVPDSRFQAQLKRHDHHSLELNSSMKLEGSTTQGELRLYMFFPQTFQLPSNKKEDVIGDFHSRARLASPRDMDLDTEEFGRELEILRDLIDQDTVGENQERIFQHIRHLGAVCGEYIKTHKSRQKRELTLMFSKANAGPVDLDEGLAKLCFETERLARAVESLRELLANELLRTMPVAKLLSQYVNQIFLDYLGSIKGQLDQAERQKAAQSRVASWVRFERMLDQLREREFNRLRIKNDPRTILEDEVEREMMVFKLSQMKKFFQSEMFVEVSAQQALKKYSEPIAAGAAAFAALWAAVFENLGSSGFSQVGFKGVFVICLSIAVYALKDRLKDRFRAVFLKKMGGYLPDVERDLKAQGKKFGEMKEWIFIKSSNQVDSEIRNFRQSACISDAEKYLPEHVLYYRRLFNVERPQGSSQDQLALMDVTRINVQRFLRHMDDAFKTVRLLDENGNFARVSSHRIYPVYVTLESCLDQVCQRQLYRVVMDKNGIVRVEALHRP